MTKQEFAQRIKQKYPQYAEVDDITLADKTIEKYPQYKDVIDKSAVEEYKATRGKVDNFTIGAGKGVISSARGLFSAREKLKKGALRTILPKRAERALGIEKKEGETTAAERLIPKELVTPEGTAQKVGFGAEQVAEFFIPVTKAAKAEKAATTGGKLVSKLKGVAREGAEFGSKTSVQTGGDLEETAKGAALGVVGGSVGEFILNPVMKQALPFASKALEKVNLRLTPAQKRNSEKAIESAVEIVQKNKITGTPAKRVEKIKDLYSKTEDDLQKFFTTEAKDRMATRADILDDLESLKGKYASERDVIAIEKQIDSIKDLLNTKYDDKIAVAALNDLKRSTYKNAYNKAGDKVLDFVEHDVGDILRKNIVKNTDDLTIGNKTFNEFNEEYGKIIETRKLLETAASRKQTGFIGKLMAMSAGGSLGSLGGGVGAAVGLGLATPVAEHLAGTLTRSLIAKGLKDISKLPAKEAEEALMKILIPLLTDRD